jgi:hypothetical protein
LKQSEEKGGRPFHAVIHEWQLGPIFELLVAGDDDHAMRATAAIDSEDRLVLGRFLDALSSTPHGGGARRPEPSRPSARPERRKPICWPTGLFVLGDRRP